MDIPVHRYPSPNYSNRPDHTAPDMIVLHYTDMLTADAALERLCDPAYEVSAHYLISECGKIYHLVDEEKKAWHAGISCWKGRSALNNYSIGIEMANLGHSNGYIPFPDAQIKACIALCNDIKSRYDIPHDHVVAHSDIAPMRKIDPGELFPWERLAAENIGLWPQALQRFPKENDIIALPYCNDADRVKTIQSTLAAIGYYIKSDGFYGPKTEKTIEAFRRRYVRHDISVSWSEHCDYAAHVLTTALMR